MDLKILTERIEAVSQSYTDKFDIKRDSDWFVFKLQEELGELTQSYLMLSQRARKKGKSTDLITKEFQDEIADVFGHILLLANHYNIDIEKAVNDKWLKWEDSKRG
ncbi:MAG: pyrophosphatase [Microgenomates group bacterium]